MMFNGPTRRLLRLTAITLLVAPALAAAQARFVYGSAAPSSGPESRALVKYFDAVEQATRGSLKIERSFDGAVVKAKATLPGVRDSLIDASFIYDTFFTTELKSTMTLVDLAVMVANPLAQAGAINETVLFGCPQCDADFGRQKVRPIAYNGVSPFYLMCREPVSSVADLKGKSIRSVSAFGVLAQAAGATPVRTVPSEVYEAMQRGQVDCGIVGGVWLRSYGLWDVVKTVPEYPLGQYNTSLLFAVNADSWKSMAPEHRKAMIERLPFLVAEATYLHLEEVDKLRAEAAAKGVQFTPPPADLVAFVENHRKGEFDRVVAAASKRGVPDADKLVRTYLDNLAKWEKIVAGTGGDRAKYEQALWTEIFGKLQ